MHCSQCSVTITDTEAVFCHRCGTRLPARMAQPSIPLAPRPDPIPDTVLLPSYDVVGRPSAAQSYGKETVESPRRRLVRIIIAALVGAAALGWVMGVTLFLNDLGNVVMEAVDNEIATKVQGRTGTYSDILNQTLNQIFVATWGWAFVGLLIGAGVGWHLTRQKVPGSLRRCIPDDSTTFGRYRPGEEIPLLQRKDRLLRQTLMRLWRTPYVKALFTARYSLAAILIYFTIAQFSYCYFGNYTWLPHFGCHIVHPAPDLSGVNMEPFKPIYYEGPGTDAYAALHPNPPAVQPRAPITSPLPVTSP